MKIIAVAVGVLLLALYGFKLSLPTANGDFEIRTGLQKQRSELPVKVIPKVLVDEEES